jgi:hypothetical protein
MLDWPTGSPTDSLKDRDERFGAAMRAVIRDPKILLGKEPDAINALIAFCMGRLSRFSMGGRSVPLVGLSVVLWNADDPVALKLDLETPLANAFAIAMDPSYIWPEWGIVLAGVIICRYIPLLPEVAQGVKNELTNQCRLRLRYLCGKDLPQPCDAVRKAAQALGEQWALGFPQGLQPVVQTCLDTWENTSGLESVTPDELQRRMGALDAIQPAWYSEEDRRFYRLGMERAGTWIVSSVVLSPA